MVKLDFVRFKRPLVCQPRGNFPGSPNCPREPTEGYNLINKKKVNIMATKQYINVELYLLLQVHHLHKEYGTASNKYFHYILRK